VIDVNGKRIMSKTVAAARGSNRVQLDNISNLVPGMYVVQIITGEGMMQEKLTVAY
jgi:hypothetical protein